MLEGNGKTQGGNREALQENLNLVQVKWLRLKAREQGKNLNRFHHSEVLYKGTMLVPMCHLSINSS